MKPILNLRITAAICTLFVMLSWAENTNADYIDAFGDAQDTFGSGGPLLDIDTINVQYDEFNLLFEMTFHTPISASLFAEDSVGGVLEFDIDQSNETGGPPLQNGFSPPFASFDTGVDFFLDLFSEAGSPGFVSLLNSKGLSVGNVAITYSADSFNGVIPLAGLWQ